MTFLLVAVPLRGVAVNTALKQLVAVKFQQLEARNLVEGNQPPPGIHPDPPDLFFRFFLSGQGDSSSHFMISSPFYAIIV